MFREIRIGACGLFARGRFAGRRVVGGPGRALSRTGRVRRWRVAAMVPAAAMGVRAVGAGSAPGAAATAPQVPRECRLMINWDQFNMAALQLTYAHAHRTPEAGRVRRKLQDVVDEHAKAGIDRIVQCVFAMPNGAVLPGFKSFPQDRFSDRLYKDTPTGFRELGEAGYDRIRIALDRARERDVEFLGGLRMNDRHSPTSAFHAAHPEWQLREFPGGMDYKHEGVRSAVLAFSEEFLGRYDVDGLELDWMRWCRVFRPEEAQRNAPLLTDLIRKLRDQLDQAAARRGRGRLLLGVRVPQTLDECRALGFDVAAWVRSGAIDFLCPSDFLYADFNAPTEEFTRLVRGTRCRVYPSLHPLIGRGNDHQLESPATYRAAARNFYAFGAHGISIYNYQYHWREDLGATDAWPGALHALAELRDPERLGQAERRYLFHPLWAGRSQSGAVKDVRLVLDRSTGEPGGALRFRIAERLREGAGSAELSFKVTGLSPTDHLALHLNGKALGPGEWSQTQRAGGQLASEGRELPPFDLFRVPLRPRWTRFGDNELRVRLSGAAGRENPVVQELEVLVRPGNGSDGVATRREGVSVPSTAGAATRPVQPRVRVASVRRIFHNGEHNAFTDLCRYRGQLYLTFRSCPDGHLVHPTASILVLRSMDGVDWDEVHRFRVPLRDTRDPHFLIFRNRLFLYTGTWYSGATTLPRDQYDLNQHLGYAAWSDDGTSWNSPVLLDGTFGHYVWRAAAFGDRAYLCGRRKLGFEVTARGEGEKVEALLLESEDGLIWRKRAVFAEEAGDETAFLFEPDGSVLGVGRHGGGKEARLLRSQPPYSRWQRTSLGQPIGGPLLTRWGEFTLVGGRKSTPDRGPKTALWWLDGDRLVELAELPSAGDNSYPGFVELSPTRALLSYYSSHERDANGQPITAIYLAELVREE